MYTRTRPWQLQPGDTYVMSPSSRVNTWHGSGDYGEQFRVRRAGTREWWVKVPPQHDPALHARNVLEALLNGRSELTIQNNTKLVHGLDDSIAVRLHETDVLTYWPGGLMRVMTGGWPTMTTRSRIDTYLPHGWDIGPPYGNHDLRAAAKVWELRGPVVDFVLTEGLIVNIETEEVITRGDDSRPVFSWPKGFHRWEHSSDNQRERRMRALGFA